MKWKLEYVFLTFQRADDTDPQQQHPPRQLAITQVSLFLSHGSKIILKTFEKINNFRLKK